MFDVGPPVKLLAIRTEPAAPTLKSMREDRRCGYFGPFGRPTLTEVVFKGVAGASAHGDDQNLIRPRITRMAGLLSVDANLLRLS